VVLTRRRGDVASARRKAAPVVDHGARIGRDGRSRLRLPPPTAPLRESIGSERFKTISERPNEELKLGRRLPAVASHSRTISERPREAETPSAG
jgi:hypothetical protein